MLTLKWRHNGRDSVSNHQPYDCLLNGLFRRRSKKTSKLRVTGLCVPGTGGFPAQMASNSENVSIWWPYHVRFPGFTWTTKTNCRITANINHGTGKEPFFKDLAKIRYMNHVHCMIACYKWMGATLPQCGIPKIVTNCIFVYYMLQIEFISWPLTVKDECHRTPFIINQPWVR